LRGAAAARGGRVEKAKKSRREAGLRKIPNIRFGLR
jgi:hypothetical protein